MKRAPQTLALLASLLVLCSACDTSGPGPDVAGGPLFPVATANVWTYESTTEPSLELRVGDPAEVGDETFYRLVITEGGRVSADPEYVRVIGTERLGAELLYTAPLASGDLYRESTEFRYPVAEGTYTVTIAGQSRSYTVTRERLTVPAGTFEAVTYSGYDGDPTVSTSFAPGVGIVRFFDGQTERRLVRYALR